MFCTDTITTDDSLRADHGVLRVSALAVTADAREAAQRILDDARAQASAMLQQAQHDANERTREAEEQTMQRAAHLIQSLEQANATFLDHAQGIVVDLAQGLFDRLVMDTTPREKLEAALKRVLQEAPPKLVNPLLRVHPDDFALLPAVEWDVKQDAGLAPGTCLLQADSGEWCADFSATVGALKEGFKQATQNDEGELSQ
jgi:flagellar biosynthesis/type III secretory pathway protein FliH